MDAEVVEPEHDLVVAYDLLYVVQPIRCHLIHSLCPHSMMSAQLEAAPVRRVVDVQVLAEDDANLAPPAFRDAISDCLHPCSEVVAVIVGMKDDDRVVALPEELRVIEHVA